MYSQRHVWINSLVDVYAFANIHTITYFIEYLCSECRIRPYSAKHGSPKKTGCKCFLFLHICFALCVCFNLSGVRAASGLRFMWFFHSGCFSWWRFLYVLAHHHTGNKMSTREYFIWKSGEVSLQPYKRRYHSGVGVYTQRTYIFKLCSSHELQETSFSPPPLMEKFISLIRLVDLSTLHSHPPWDAQTQSVYLSRLGREAAGE